MLPVLGLLRTYPCPHAIAGLCARPNCFYSHKKSDILQTKKKISSDLVLSQSEQSIVADDGGNADSETQPGPSPSKQISITRKREAEEITETDADEKSKKRSRRIDQLKSDQEKAQNSITKLSTEAGPKADRSPKPPRPQNSQSTGVEATLSKSSTTETNGIKSNNDRKKDVSHNSLKTETKVEKVEITKEGEAVAEASDFMLPESESADEDDPDQIALECLQMFNNYKPDHPGEGVPMTTTPKEPNPPPEDIVRNKRVAHSGASDSVKAKVPTPPKPRMSATETMLRRYELAKQQDLFVSTEQKAQAPIRPPPDGKKRIAHVANVSSLMKPATGTTISLSSEKRTPSAATASTVAHTIGKGESRQAHTPKLPEITSIPAPKIPWESARSSKIPVVVRQKILDQLFQECRKIYDQPQDAAQRALAEEKELSTRCSSKAVYFCSGTNAVSRLRKEVNAGPASGSSKGGAISHLSVIAGASGARNSWSIESVKKMSWPPPGPLLYIGLTRYLLTEEQLVTNAFPRKSPLGGGRAIITCPSNSKPTVDLNAHPFSRICDRCTKSYKVDRDGLPVVREKCVYHNGRKFKRKVNGVIEGRYTCCDGDVSAEGCSLSDYHVSAQCSNQLRGFVTAINDAGDEDSMGSDPWDIIALDCEMIYTTHGNELARVTIIGSNKEVLYDEFVKPIHPVLDYNTKFSGITEALLDNATTTLTDVQAVLLTRLKSNTIIVGHSLENDLLALKLIHSTVVDTSVLFPHRLGPPLKRALRNLSTECLGKIIQMGEGGHDSAEDARSALELALWKLKEDSKLQDCFSRPLKD